MPMPTAAEIADAAARTAFGGPIVSNVYRALVAEAIVAAVLEPRWRRAGAIGSASAFERGRYRLEVRQAAALRAMDEEPRREHEIGFDVRPRPEAQEPRTRAAREAGATTTFLFAFHGEGDPDFADHRDPEQWRFFLVPRQALPTRWRVTLPAVRRLAPELRFGDLGAAIEGLDLDGRRAGGCSREAGGEKS